MKGWSRKLALVLALLVMPLQGMAATLSVLLCHGDAQVHAAHEHGATGHDHVAADHAADAHHGTVSDDGASAAYHLCCNMTVPVPYGALPPGAAPDFPPVAGVQDTLHDLYIPDRPQRPPLA